MANENGIRLNKAGIKFQIHFFFKYQSLTYFCILLKSMSIYISKKKHKGTDSYPCKSRNIMYRLFATWPENSGIIFLLWCRGSCCHMQVSQNSLGVKFRCLQRVVSPFFRCYSTNWA